MTPLDIDALAQEIRRVDGKHDLGAGQLAEALMPFLSASQEAAAPSEEPVAWRETPSDIVEAARVAADMVGVTPYSDMRVHVEHAVRYALLVDRASPAVAPVADAKQKIIEFAQAILHGDDEHRGWLMGAALAFNAGDELPAPRGKGTAPVAVSVKVKPLEWRDAPIPPSWECLASSAVGLYCIPLGRKLFALRFRDKDTLGEFDTLAAAKAAAQSDFNARILSSIIPATKGGEDVGTVTPEGE